MRENRSEQNKTKNKKADKKNQEKNGPQKESGKKSARSRVEHVSSEEDKETTGDVGNDSGKTVTIDGRESDHDGKVNECSEQDDTNNSVGVGDRDKNEDVSSEEDQETSGDVGNDSRKTFTGDGRESDHDGKVNEHSEQDDTNNSVGVGDRDKNEDVSSEEDQETSGDVGNDSRKTFTGDGRESDHDGKVNEHSEQDDTNNSVGVSNPDKNLDVSSEEYKKTTGEVGNDSRKTVTIDGRESDHDGKVNERSEQDDTNNSVGVGNCDKNQDFSSEGDKQTTGDVGNDSGKTVTSDGRESDRDGKVNERSEQDDISNSVGVGNRDNNQDVSSEQDQETSGDVGESDHDGKVNEHLVHDDTYNSVDADNRDKNQDVSLEEDKNTSGNVRNDSGKTVTGYGRESDYDGKVNEPSVQDDTSKSVCAGNRDKNEDNSSEEDKKTSGIVGNDSGKTVTIDGRKIDHDGKFNEHSVHDDKNNSVGVDNRDKNQEENGPQKSRVEDVSSEEDKETSGDVGNDSGKIVMIDGRESDHDGKVSERSVKDDTNNSVDVGNRDKNQEENGPQKSGVDVTSEEDKETSGNVGNNEKEVLQSDFDSSDDDNVPLSTFKMSSSVSHESTACFTDIDADNARDDAAYDGSTFGIEGIIDRLTDNEYKDEIDYSMSMEEYRLTYAQDFLKGGVFDEGTIIKETRHEVDRQIFSQSDTTVTTVTDESPNVSSDSEPEIVIHRKKVSKKKKKRFIMKKRII